MKKPVIIDCDPGYDDALALLLALYSEKLDVLGICATAGNVELDKTYKNVVRICEFLEKGNIAIGKGMESPILTELVSGAKIHSESGLGGVNIPEDVKMPKEISSVELMKKIFDEYEGEENITIITIGPLTNVAIFLLAFPKYKKKIKEIIMMGGAVNSGNRTAMAEFNIYADAHAAKIVFRSGVPIVMAGLDVTTQFQVYEEEFKMFKKMGKKGIFAYEILENYNNFYKKLGKKYRGPVLHDVVAVAYAIDNKMFEGEKYFVDVEVEHGLCYGKTVVDTRKNDESNNILVLLKLDREKLLEKFVYILVK